MLAHSCLELDGFFKDRMNRIKVQVLTQSACIKVAFTQIHVREYMILTLYILCTGFLYINEQIKIVLNLKYKTLSSH